MGHIQSPPHNTTYSATFKILRSCYIGTIKRRFFNKEEYISRDYGEAEQLRRSASAMELPVVEEAIDEAEVGSEETAEEVTPAKEETAEERKARLRDQMMDKENMPTAELQKLAKDNGVRYVGVKRKTIVDGILAATAEMTVPEAAPVEEADSEEAKGRLGGIRALLTKSS